MDYERNHNNKYSELRIRDIWRPSGFVPYPMSLITEKLHWFSLLGPGKCILHPIVPLCSILTFTTLFFLFLSEDLFLCSAHLSEGIFVFTVTAAVRFRSSCTFLQVRLLSMFGLMCWRLFRSCRRISNTRRQVIAVQIENDVTAFLNLVDFLEYGRPLRCYVVLPKLFPKFFGK